MPPELIKMEEVFFSPTNIRILTEEELGRAERTIKAQSGQNTLCETIREIYRFANQITDQNVKAEIKKRCLVILAYAKRMDNKLVEYARKSE